MHWRAYCRLDVGSTFDDVLLFGNYFLRSLAFGQIICTDAPRTMRMEMGRASDCVFNQVELRIAHNCKNHLFHLVHISNRSTVNGDFAWFFKQLARAPLKRAFEFSLLLIEITFQHKTDAHTQLLTYCFVVVRQCSNGAPTLTSLFCVHSLFYLSTTIFYYVLHTKYNFFFLFVYSNWLAHSAILKQNTHTRAYTHWSRIRSPYER